MAGKLPQDIGRRDTFSTNGRLDGLDRCTPRASGQSHCVIADGK